MRLVVRGVVRSIRPTIRPAVTRMFGKTPVKVQMLQEDRLNEEYELYQDEERDEDVDEEEEEVVFKRIYTTVVDLELEVYRVHQPNIDLKIVRGMLEGRSLSKVNPKVLKENFFQLIQIDLGLLPDKHLPMLLKWTGTSPLRRHENDYTAMYVMALYNELRNRRLLDHFLLVREDNIEEEAKHNPKRSISCSLMIEKDPSLRDKPADLYKKYQADPHAMSDDFDLLISLSNLNIYLHEFYQSAKLILLYVTKQKQKNSVLEKLMILKCSNYLWCFMRMRDLDIELFDNLFLANLQPNQKLNAQKQLMQLHLMSTWYLLTPPARRSANLVAAIDQSLDMLTSSIQEEGYSRTSIKVAYIHIQIVLSLFPEVAPHLREDTLEKAKPSQTNPFARHFRSLNKICITSLWLISANKKKMLATNLSCTERPNYFVISSFASIYNSSRRFEHQVLKAMNRVGGQRKIEHSKVVACYEIDFVVDDTKAIEVNSKTHFLYKTNYFMLADLVKKTHLELLGLTQVVDINYFEANKYLRKGESALEEYVRSVLDQLE